MNQREEDYRLGRESMAQSVLLYVRSQLSDIDKHAVDIADDATQIRNATRDLCEMFGVEFADDVHLAELLESIAENVRKLGISP